jgi:hypothetical protein
MKTTAEKTTPEIKKRKIAALSVFAVAALSVGIFGAATAFAASDSSAEPPAIPAGARAVRMVDGELLRSVDGGETWTDEIPADVQVGDDGSVSVTVEADESEGMSAFFNGVSFDVGEEFGEVRDLTAEEVSEFLRNYSDARFNDSDRVYETESRSMWVEMESDGSARYSDDGGVTWNDGLPAGYDAGFSISVVDEIED